MIERYERTDAPSDDDEALLRASWQEPNRFAEIFHRHFAEIHGYIARRLGALGPTDLAAETFLAAFRAGTGSIRPAVSVRPCCTASPPMRSATPARRTPLLRGAARTPADLVTETTATSPWAGRLGRPPGRAGGRARGLPPGTGTFCSWCAGRAQHARDRQALGFRRGRWARGSPGRSKLRADWVGPIPPETSRSAMTELDQIPTFCPPLQPVPQPSRPPSGG